MASIKPLELSLKSLVLSLKPLVISLWLLTLLFVTVLFAPASYGISHAIVGEKQILLQDKQGQEHFIGTVYFKSRGEHSSYQLKLDHHPFVDYFLSMKEMKCLEGPELWCHLPYPYQQPRTVTQNDLSWLSHDLLFMFKRKSTFGANFWNGIYYELRVKDGVIVGEAQAVDLNLLASPPEDLNQPVMTEAERDEIEREQRWLPDIIIR